jgi:hypothetical protein
VTARLSDQTLLDRLQQLSSSTPRSVPLPATGYEHQLHATRRRIFPLEVPRPAGAILVMQRRESLPGSSSAS